MPRPKNKSKKRVRAAKLLSARAKIDWTFQAPAIWAGLVEDFLTDAPSRPLFDLIVSSPPYNIGKEYERRESLDQYLKRQTVVIQRLVRLMKPRGSLCWQVGNFVRRDEVIPLDIVFHQIFQSLGLKLQNRIVWHFGHGLHSNRRFSGRYEVVLWYTKGSNYKFNLDSVRVKSKYPGKKFYKGKNKGKFSSNPLGKNPEDVWQIPNVKANHIEKTKHPCQFPVGLIERLILALTNKNDLVFDPFCGVASAGVAALHHKRRFVGCEKLKRYANVGLARLGRAQQGTERFRPHDQAIYDHTKSKLSLAPDRTSVSPT